MPKEKKRLWRFFASVKFALTILIILAVISILGTLIKQGQEPSYYVQVYGENVSRIFEVLGITEMYRSWWFTTLLCLFAFNLIVCSLDRLPRVYHLVTMDNLRIDPRQLDKKSSTHCIDTVLEAAAVAEKLPGILSGAGWKNPRHLDRQGTILFFAQKGAWSRFGVYFVHLSILVIMLGAIIGTAFGLKAYVYLPEGMGTKKVFLEKNQAPVPLGFEVLCNRLERTFYPNGMLKQPRLDLTVLDPDHKTTFRQSTIINAPLRYRGFSFYLINSYPMGEFSVEISNRTTGSRQIFRVAPKRNVTWQGTDVSFQIVDYERNKEGAVSQAKIRFSDGAATKPYVFWIKNKGTEDIRQGGEDYTISIRQLYSTLLLVNKDPGVLFVYAGCILMVLGLAIVFFFSHGRIWLRITPEEKQQGSQILVSGTSNKNKPAFERRFQQVVDQIVKDLA